MMSTKIHSLEIELNNAKRDMRYGDAAELKEKIFQEEKLIFLKALNDFRKSTIDLADSWICCGDILEELTIVSSYPFDQDFQSMELLILKWIEELETNINKHKGE
jgi:hypothetical protein